MGEGLTAGITGPFSDVNFGDYAMLVNNVLDLQIEDIVLFSYNRMFLDVIREDYLRGFNIDIVDVHLNEGLKGFLVPGKGDNIVPFEMMALTDNYEELKSKIMDIDILIVNGGGYFNSLWSMPHRIGKLICIIIPILIANQIGKKIVFTGNSYGPFGEDAQLFSCLFTILNNVTLGCRDNLYSPMWLRQIGMDVSHVKYIPDDLFPVNNGILKLETNSRINSDDYIVMETYLPVDYIKANLRDIKEFSEIMYKTYGLSIVFLPFHLGDGGENQAIYLQGELNHYEYYDIISKGYLPIQDAVEIIRNSKMVICSRYHAFVLALCYGVPVLNVMKDVLGDRRYYYNKSYGLLREVLRGSTINERLYLGTDYMVALASVAREYHAIISKQTDCYDEKYYSNKERLEGIRRTFLKEILYPC